MSSFAVMEKVARRGIALIAGGLLAMVGVGAAHGQDHLGGSAAEFLNIGVSPRAAGMADSYFAMVEGPEATHYNAAALPWQEDGLHLAANHLEWFAGINHEFIGVSQNFGQSIGTFGASLTALYTDEMDVTTPLQQEGTGETFYATNLRASVSYARWFTDRVTFGGTISYINLALAEGFSEHAAALNIAASYRAEHFRNFRFGMKIANLGNEVEFVDESYPLPITFVFGAQIDAIQWDDHRVTLTGTGIKPDDISPQGQVGMEYAFQDMLFLRGGYRIQYTVAQFGLGGGVKLGSGDRMVRVDYGYSAYELLGGAHRLGVNISI